MSRSASGAHRLRDDRRDRADVEVRVIHGDANPAGPGFREEEVACDVAGEPHDGYGNNVSRMTRNVLERFRDPRPLDQETS